MPPRQKPQPPQQAPWASATANSGFQELGADSGNSEQPFTLQDFRRQPLKELLPVPASGATDPPHQPHLAHHASSLPLRANTKFLEKRFLARSDAHADMFLSPSSVPQGEKILRLVEFLKNIVPQESEKTLSDMGGSCLVISHGQQRPRLENVTLSHWVVANIRIFYTLLFSHELPTARDVRDYLAYAVKVMELAAKYEWQHVLEFDDE